MKAITIKEFGGPEVLLYEDIQEPEIGTEDVKVNVMTAGVNPNDAYVRVGNYGFLIPDPPYTPGFDGAGIVEEVGGDVEHLQVGDRVFIAGALAKRNTGTYAQKAVVSADAVYPLPEAISFEEGAALGIPSMAAYRAIFQKAGLREGETVLIHGASGGVGTMAVQMAKAAHAEVIGTASTKEGKELLRSLGCDHVIDHVTQENQAVLMELTDGRGPDVIIEFLANVNLETDLAVIAKFGRIVIVGNRGSIEITPRNAMAKEANILGMAVFHSSEEETAAALQEISAFMQYGLLKPVIGEVRELSEASAVHEVLLTKAGKGKTILRIPQD